uniref:Uncharacterized protein n=1 Tax=Ailuropoda melanoleuca TaxID=9646 RepID=A0A7N5JU78_AILME
MRHRPSVYRRRMSQNPYKYKLPVTPHCYYNQTKKLIVIRKPLPSHKYLHQQPGRKKSSK